MSLKPQRVLLTSLSFIFAFILFTQVAFATLPSSQIPAEAREFVQLIREYNISSDCVVVLGYNMDAPEVALVELIRTQPLPSNISGPTYLDDSDATLALLENESRDIILIGGPTQNRISREYWGREWIAKESVKEKYGFMLKMGQTPKGARVFMGTDSRGFLNLPREGASYSPLRFVVDPKYIPAAATGASISLMALWVLARTVVERYILGLGKKAVKPVPKPALKILGIKLREVASVLLSAFVFAAAITWVFAGPTEYFFPLFLVSIIISFLTIIGHELVHMLFSRLFGLKTEYKFWWSGSLFTLFSAYLGNPFGLTGFVVDEEDVGMKRSFALMKLSAPLASAGAAILFAGLNFIYPWDIFQIIFTMASTLAVVEMLPFEPLDGRAVWKWSPFAWFFPSCIIAFIYLVVNFVV